MAQANMPAGRVRPTIEYADRAIAEARTNGSERVQAQVLVGRWSCSAVEQRRAIIERMRANAESAGFAALAAYSYAEHLSELASLSNILTKLGMRSRTEIAAWAIRTGVADSGVERAG